MKDTDFTEVTEVAGEEVSREQIQRMWSRYYFARQYIQGKDVLELACGSGQGLGYLAKAAKRIVGGDYSDPLLRLAGNHYRGRIPLLRLDAQSLPFRKQSFDIVILYEAIYYLPQVHSFIQETHRVLRSQGILLICTANKSLPDFNPSRHSHQYFSPEEFLHLLSPLGFRVECYGNFPVDYSSLKQRILSGVKQAMVRFDLMPKTMGGKKLFKRLVFGKLVPLPAELQEEMAAAELPCAIPCDQPDTCHKVIFAVAKK